MNKSYYFLLVICTLMFVPGLAYAAPDSVSNIERLQVSELERTTVEFAQAAKEIQNECGKPGANIKNVIKTSVTTHVTNANAVTVGLPTNYLQDFCAQGLFGFMGDNFITITSPIEEVIQKIDIMIMLVAQHSATYPNPQQEIRRLQAVKNFLLNPNVRFSNDPGWTHVSTRTWGTLLWTCTQETHVRCDGDCPIELSRPNDEQRFRKYEWSAGLFANWTTGGGAEGCCAGGDPTRRFDIIL